MKLSEIRADKSHTPPTAEDSPNPQEKPQQTHFSSSKTHKTPACCRYCN